VRFKTLPGISEIIEGKINISQIKDVEIEDLLGREQVKLDEESIHQYLTGKRVLVTGAAGSIGSELCRQIARYAPSKLLLLDSAETPLYHIEKEISEIHPELRVVPLLADIRQNIRLESVFETFMPEVVFHAAAYKHVPMMEYNPVEAVTNNVMGTRQLADLAHRFGVATFVMVSTDKAVNPTNIMGASKRVAELYVQALARRSRTKFTTVRFGNVLGSNGSVIPLFMEQIRKGGPVTVTHRDVIRYFMTIPEASQLVLQTGCIGNGGEIFVLDMGEPVRIVDLAEELISLSGMTPYDDIDIVFTGLRPGEKLFEELLIEGEGIMPTTHHKIKVLESLQVDFEALEANIGLLDRAAGTHNLTELMGTLKEIVTEFKPSYSFEGEAPLTFQRVRPDLFVVE
jgi:FlaA1/EpsC-like NDP-sugar epimerase